MEHKGIVTGSKGLLQTEELYEYMMNTSVYPREAQVLKELREATASHPMAMIATAPDSGQLMALLLNIIKPKKTIEIGVFTGYSLLLTALSIPEDGKITAIDISRESYEIGLPFIRKAGLEHKVDFIESRALPALDSLLNNEGNEGSFEFAFVDADKGSYWGYHERLMKLLKVGGIVAYDNTLWAGTVAMSDEAIPETMKESKLKIVEFNKLLAADSRVQICQIPLGDGITVCRRIN